MRSERVHEGLNVLSVSKESCEDLGGDHQILACQKLVEEIRKKAHFWGGHTHAQI